MSETNASLLNLVNSSGYLLQLRLEQAIKHSEGSHNWAFVGHEYHWINYETGEDGFIDIVLNQQKLRMIMVIECKRVLDASWVFLVSDRKAIRISRARLYWSHSQAERKYISGWCDFVIPPNFPESAFCVIRGQSDKDKPMLERIGGIVLQSVTSLAEEEAALRQPKSGTWHIYIPVIITTASIEVCCINLTDINIDNGQLPDGKGSFEKVPFVAFRKGMAPIYNFSKPQMTLDEASLEKEQTIFVVQASEFLSFLHQLKEISLLDSYQKYPWISAREQEDKGSS